MGWLTPTFNRPQASSDSPVLRRWSDSRKTRAGMRVDEQTALGLSAVLCATRVISEAISSLPLNLIEMMGDKRRRIAWDNPLQTLLHESPNPEQDSLGWFDQLIPWQVNAGTAFAEIQRYDDGTPYALWPIHPSRIPLHNIRRNNRAGDIRVGKPGELVFYVKSGDGEVVPVAQEDMLVVPGVLSPNGITGRGLVDIGAEAIGVAQAVEAHAGAFFANGAVPGLFVNYEAKLSPEKYDFLRTTFAKRYEGVDNHYRSFLVDGGKATAQMLGVDPEKTQLLQARQFSIAEVSRIWRVPMHMLSDLSRATWTNVESQGIEFVVQSLRPWIIRWERALNRQLLTDAQRERFYFKFNLNALLRGDSQARASFYQTMQQMGVFSINEIRDLEDLDPIENGDVRLIPSNNMTPLDDVVNGTDETPPQQPKPPAQPVDDSQDDNAWYVTATDSVGTITVRAPQQPDPVVETSTEQKPTLVAATRLAKVAIAHTIDNLVKYEVRRLERAAKKPGEFIPWMETFYAETLPAAIASTSESVVVTLATMGIATSANEIASHYCDQSRELLDVALSEPAATFAAKVKEITDSWATRAEVLAEELMGTK